MLEMRDLYWLAGILEGEGYFGLQTRPNGTKYPKIKVEMIDSDIIYRAARIMGGKEKVTLENKPLKSGKLIYVYSSCGELAIQWMMTLYSVMGDRRKERIREILDVWKAQEDVLAIRRIKGVCRHGHKWVTENIGIIKGKEYCKVCANWNAQFNYWFNSLSEDYPTLKPKELKEKFFEIKAQETDKQELN